MIYMNGLMKDYFDEDSNRTQNLAREIVNGIRNVRDCLVYDKEGKINENDLDFDRIIKMNGDKTGYEISCNEIRINKLSKNQIISFLIEFDRTITAKFSRKVVIYIQDLEECMELRFHSFREDEKLWLSENLDGYDIPILCYIS